MNFIKSLSKCSDCHSDLQIIFCDKMWNYNFCVKREDPCNMYNNNAVPSVYPWNNDFMVVFNNNNNDMNGCSGSADLSSMRSQRENFLSDNQLRSSPGLNNHLNAAGNVNNNNVLSNGLLANAVSLTTGSPYSTNHLIGATPNGSITNLANNSTNNNNTNPATMGGRSRSSSGSQEDPGDDDSSPEADNAVTPPALQGLGASGHQMFGAQMSLSHYGGGLGAMAAAGLRGPPSVTGRRYQCKLCPVMFESKGELQLHTQVHMREAKPYKCSHCPKNFANSSYLSQHMRIHLNLKPFGPCQYCGRKFTQLSHLQQHLRTHTGDKPYKCRFQNCEKAFSQLSNLQSHSRCHASNKPFKCNSCYKCFDDEASLHEHIPKHKESKHLKVHICHYCGKSYTQATYLAKHMTKHADRKPIKTAASSAASAAAAAAAAIDEHVWSRDTAALCAAASQGLAADSCVESSPSSALSFNSFHQAAHSHMMQTSNCAYTSAGIASSMAAAGMGAAAAADHSAFTRLTGLPLSGRLAAASAGRNPYPFAYDNFKPNAHSAAGLAHHHNPSYNQFIRLDDIRSYAGQAAAAASAEHFNMLIKRDPRETAY